MKKSDLVEHYRRYIACLNQQDWPNLGAFVHSDAHYNGRLIGLSGYRAMLEDDFKAIPDLSFWTCPYKTGHQLPVKLMLLPSA